MTGSDPLELLRQSRVQAQPAAATPECLDDDTLAALVEGSLDSTARADALQHVAGCAHCRGALASVAGALADPSVAAEVGQPRRRRWLLPLGIAAAAAVVLLIVWPPAEETGPSTGTRGRTSGSPVRPVPIAPRATVERVSQFVWSSVPRVEHYRLRLYNAEGSVLWAVETADTIAVTPEFVTLSPGITYFWKIEAQIEWQRWSASNLVEFRIGRARP